MKMTLIRVKPKKEIAKNMKMTLAKIKVRESENSQNSLK